MSALELEIWIEENVFESQAWLEKRGEYTHFIWQRKGEREPYYGSRDWEVHVKRFTKIKGSEFNPMKHVGHGFRRFTTDPAAAMAVLEKCCKDGVHCLRIEWCGGKYQICDEVNDGMRIAEAETLPLAICLFARQLFGKEEE